MKKFICVIISFILALPLVTTVANFSYATSTQVSALIDSNYYSNADKFNIDADEIKAEFRPFDEETKQMLSGQSIQPVGAENKSFNKQYKTNPVHIDESCSIFIYVFFNQINTHNLMISANDDAGNSLSWTIGYTQIEANLLVVTDSSRERFGWLKLELPVSVATKSGEISEITQLEMEYSSNRELDDKAYSYLYFYYPTVSGSENNEISVIERQKYYNFNFNFGTNLDTKCVNDSYVIGTFNKLLDYCILGADNFDYASNAEAYGFKLTITSPDEIITYNINDKDSYTYKFKTEGSHYLKMSIFFKDDSEFAIASQTQKIEVRTFVAAYIPNKIADCQINKKYAYNIELGSLVNNVYSITATSSSNKIAEVMVENDVIYIDAKSAGTIEITLSVEADRDGVDKQTYTYTYKVRVVEQKSTNWILIIIGVIALIILCVIVYTIMVKRRLIKNKYPKY